MSKARGEIDHVDLKTIFLSQQRLQLRWNIGRIVCHADAKHRTAAENGEGETRMRQRARHDGMSFSVGADAGRTGVRNRGVGLHFPPGGERERLFHVHLAPVGSIRFSEALVDDPRRNEFDRCEDADVYEDDGEPAK